jgi:hypothetical protein
VRYTFFKHIVVAIVVCFTYVQACGITRHGLIIGIGRYEDKAWSKIHGDRDVPIVKKMLTDVGYTDITTLVNEQATKNAIIRQFQRLVDKSAVGDVVYIHFSGHGQRMTDVNGDEDDGWDEAWIPYDAMMEYSKTYHGEKHLSDDEIGMWMTKLRSKVGASGQILLVVDACHSGDSSRGLDSICVRGVFNDFVIPQPAAKRKTAQIEENWLTLSACKSYQLNSELPSHYGRLTYALYENRRRLATLTNDELLQLIETYMDDTRARGMRPQSPILTGNTSTYSVKSAFAK